MPNYKATQAICELYQVEHENEFKTGGWAIDKHRKRFMDWMSKKKQSDIDQINGKYN